MKEEDCPNWSKKKHTPISVMVETIEGYTDDIELRQEQLAAMLKDLDNDRLKRECLLKILDQIEQRPQLFEPSDGSACY